VRLARELQEKYPPDPSSPRGVWQVLRTGASDMMEHIPAELLDAAAVDDEHRRVMHELGLRSYVCVPLKLRGRILGAISFVTAESGRRYTTRDLALAEDLANRAAVAIENARLYGDLREADRRKDEFLAMLAHELRNPLAPIGNALQIMRLAPDDEEVVANARGTMERQFEHLVRLVDDLLDVSRIMRGKIDLRLEKCTVTSLVERAVEAARPLISARRHRLSIDVPQEATELVADPVRVTQVIANLLNNAAKYTPEGGEIALTAACEGDEFQVSVRDNGIGISAEALPRVFDMFVQAREGLVHSQGGLGIGLTLVKSLVQLHGGRVEARSDGAGRGAEFLVHLPLLCSLTLDDKTTRSGAPIATRRMMVVDDNIDSASTLAFLLRSQNHQVMVAHDGYTALEIVEEFTPDIAVLDIGMPGMDGYELARRLRDRYPDGKLQLVALTGWGGAEDRERTRRSGFDFHLVKPIRLEDLAEIMSRNGKE
jgi:signal transduction histidine kinase